MKKMNIEVDEKIGISTNTDGDIYGDRFIDLVAKYELFVESVIIYKLGGFFDGPS